MQTDEETDSRRAGSTGPGSQLVSEDQGPENHGAASPPSPAPTGQQLSSVIYKCEIQWNPRFSLIAMFMCMCEKERETSRR